jgi:hypothetical protein
MHNTLTDVWFWLFVGAIVGDLVFRWVDRELLRLRKLRLKILADSIQRAEKILDDQIKAWKVLENLAPAEAERVWEVIKNRVVSNWWPNDKEKEGGN